MYGNSSCTLYLASKNYEKVIIPHCFLTHRKIAAAVRTGLDYTESAFCMINGNSDLVFTAGKDFLVEGVCDIDFVNDQGKGQSDSIKAIQDAGGYTVMLADWKGYGSRGMRHWEISCK